MQAVPDVTVQYRLKRTRRITDPAAVASRSILSALIPLRRAGPLTIPVEPATANTRQWALVQAGTSPGTPASHQTGFGDAGEVQRGVGQGDEADAVVEQPGPVGGGVEPTGVVEERVVGHDRAGVPSPGPAGCCGAT